MLSSQIAETRDERRARQQRELDDVLFAARYARTRASKPQLSDENRAIAAELAKGYERDAAKLSEQLRG